MLAEILHKILSMEAEPDRPYYPRPSIAGPERCLRQLVYWARGDAKKAFAGRMLQVLSDSSWGEETTADLIRKSAFQLHSEQMGASLRNALPWMPDTKWRCKACDKDIPHKDLHGHIDYIVTDIMGTDYLTDHKSINHFSHQRYCGEGVPLDYFYQLAVYARGLQEYNPGLKGILLLMKNKNTSGYLEFRGEYDAPSDTLCVFEKTFHTGERQEINLIIPNITNNAIARFAEVEKHRKAGTLPARQYTLDDWQCQYCSYSENLCWKGWEQEHALLTEDVVLDEEISTLVRYERETALHEASAKKEREELKEKLKQILKERGIRSGKTSEYIVEWTVAMGKKFDKDLLPPGVYAAASKDVPVEKLHIRKIKTTKEEKK